MTSPDEHAARLAAADRLGPSPTAADLAAAGFDVNMVDGREQVALAVALAISSDLDRRVREALERGHGPDCEEPDEENRGRCVCGQVELAAELALEGRYLGPREREHADPATDDLRMAGQDVPVRPVPDEVPADPVQEPEDDVDRRPMHERSTPKETPGQLAPERKQAASAAVPTPPATAEVERIARRVHEDRRLRWGYAEESLTWDGLDEASRSNLLADVRAVLLAAAT